MSKREIEDHYHAFFLNVYIANYVWTLYNRLNGTWPSRVVYLYSI